jgi:hypothetical protein
MKTAILVILLTASSNKGETIPQTLHWVHFDVQRQGSCEAACFACIAEGSRESEECEAAYRLCCHMAGGHAQGCGCREGL